MINIIRLFNIRRFLTKDACHSLVLGLVISHLDYANVLFMGLPECQIKKLQRIQNMSAELVLNKRKYDRKTFAARSLSVLGAGWWNSLPENIKTVPVYDRFKVKLKTYLFELYYS